MLIGTGPAIAVTMIVAATAIIGCGASDDGGSDAAGADDASGELLVFAAASLTDAFEQIESAFEAGHPAVDVSLNLAGSATLREQLLDGAPASVFAPADAARMDEVAEAELIAEVPVVFATNSLTIAVPAGNPGAVEGLDDFADDGLLLGACAVGVPCGDLGAAAFAQAGVDPAIDTFEPDVRSLLTKLAVGELDAGLVYVTDVAARPDAIEAIALPAGIDTTTDYPIATLLDAPNPGAAAAFVEFVLSPDGQAVLVDNGFRLP